MKANSIRGVVQLFLPNEVKVTEWFYGPKRALHSAAKAVEGGGLVLMVGKWARVDVYPNTYDETFVGRRTHLLNDHSQVTSHQLTFTERPLQIYQMNVSYRDIGGAIHCSQPPSPSHSLLSHP